MDLPTFATYQTYPSPGSVLAKSLDTLLSRLREHLRDEPSGKVYSYVMTSVQVHEGVFHQEGCGPNFQGDQLTLCSCMNQMRTLEDVEPGSWISGLTGLHRTTRGNGLFYLTKVQDTAISQYELWNKLTADVRRGKAAHLDIFGDVFEPVARIERSDDPAAFNASSYKPPMAGHVHARPRNPNRWHEDIDYVHWKSKRRQAFIIGDPEETYIWTKPTIYFRGPHPRYKGWNIQEFLGMLTA